MFRRSIHTPLPRMRGPRGRSFAFVALVFVAFQLGFLLYFITKEPVPSLKFLSSLDPTEAAQARKGDGIDSQLDSRFHVFFGDGTAAAPSFIEKEQEQEQEKDKINHHHHRDHHQQKQQQQEDDVRKITSTEVDSSKSTTTAAPTTNATNKPLENDPTTTAATAATAAAAANSNPVIIDDDDLDSFSFHQPILAIITASRNIAELNSIERLLNYFNDSFSAGGAMVICSVCSSSSSLHEQKNLLRQRQRLEQQYNENAIRFVEAQPDPTTNVCMVPEMLRLAMQKAQALSTHPGHHLPAMKFFMILAPEFFPSINLPRFLHSNLESLEAEAESKKSLFVLTAVETTTSPITTTTTATSSTNDNNNNNNNDDDGLDQMYQIPQYFKDVREVGKAANPFLYGEGGGGGGGSSGGGASSALQTLRDWIDEGRVWIYQGKHTPELYQERMLSTYAVASFLSLAKQQQQQQQQQQLFALSFNRGDMLPKVSFFLGHIHTHIGAFMRLTEQIQSDYRHEIQITFQEYAIRLSAAIKEQLARFSADDNNNNNNNNNNPAAPSDRFEIKLLSKVYVVAGPRPLLPGVTLATHLSLDRINSLQLALWSWKGPVSASFCVYSKDMCDNVQQFASQMQQKRGSEYPFVVKCVYHDSAARRALGAYPVNILRNTVLGITDTELVFLIDVDFVPDDNLFEYITREYDTPAAVEEIDWLPVTEVLEVADNSARQGVPKTKIGEVNPHAASNYEISRYDKAIGIASHAKPKLVQGQSLRKLIRDKRGVFVVPGFEYNKRLLQLPSTTNDNNNNNNNNEGNKDNKNNENSGPSEADKAMYNSGRYLREAISVLHKYNSSAADLPFEQQLLTEADLLHSPLPKDFDGLAALMNDGSIVPILVDEEPSAHFMPINYSRWLVTQHMYEVECNFPFEPYVIGHTTDMPIYDERFTFYGNDKVMHHYKMDLMGFRYFVIPNHFIIHVPHNPGEWAQKERKDAYKHVRKATRVFTKELRKDYTMRFNLKKQKTTISDKLKAAASVS